jgi:hypothetical protein
MNSVELQQMTFNIHKVGHHLPTDVVTLTPCSEGWVIFSDDGLEVWSETYSSASVALMRASALVRCYELDHGAFITDAGIFEREAEQFLEKQVI